MAEDRLDRWERLEVEKRRKRAELAARVEAELPPTPPYPLPPQWEPAAGWSQVYGRPSVDPVENAKAALRAYAERRGPVKVGPSDPVVVWSYEDFARLYGPGPLAVATAEQMRRERPWVEAVEERTEEFHRLFEYVVERWREYAVVPSKAGPPWWARAIGWGIAVYYAVRSVRG